MVHEETDVDSFPVHCGFTPAGEREIWQEVSISFFHFFLLIDLECLTKTQVREIRKYFTPLCRSILRTPENNVVKCIKGKNAKKEKAGAPAKTNSIILNRRDGVPRIFAKPRSASFHTTRFDLKFTLAFKICPLAKLGNSLSREDPNFIDLLIFLKNI